MRNHPFNIGKIRVGGRVGPRQDVLGVENIQPFILHRAHIEVADGNDHK